MYARIKHVIISIVPDTTVKLFEYDSRKYVTNPNGIEIKERERDHSIVL
jgi:hypothetical protein